MSREALIPERGKLAARVFANPHIALPPTLFYDIEIPTVVVLGEPLGRPFFAADEPRTIVVLEFIDLGLIDWRTLPGKEFRFPTNSEDGYVDGSIYLGTVHNAVDAICIRFGELQGSLLSTTLNLEFDLSCVDPRPNGLDKSFHVCWNVELEVNADELDGVMAEARRVVGNSR